MSDGSLFFYSIVVIIDILVGIVTYFLFVIFWITHKVNNVFNKLYINHYDCVRNLCFKLRTKIEDS